MAAEAKKRESALETHPALPLLADNDPDSTS